MMHLSADDVKGNSYFAPFRLLVITIASLFMAEAVVMVVLSYLSPFSPLFEALIDAVLLCLIVFPILHLTLFRPMLLHIASRKEAEAEKEALILQLREALDNVKTLKGLLPICASCKNIRDDKGYWSEIEVYISKNSDAEFTHGFCPECVQKLYPDIYKRIQDKM